MTHFLVIDTLETKQIEQLLNLYKQTWWANDRKREEILIMLESSLSFVLLKMTLKI